MKTHSVALAAAFLALSAGAGLAATSDIASHSRADRFAPGKHQFYAWCANGQDFAVAQDGRSAEDARSKLAANGCRLAWQGRIRP
jgi:hypothetical protein